MFPGYWYPSSKIFNTIGGRTGCWLSDGNYVVLDEDNMNHYNDYPEFGFSLRLLKN